MLRPPGTRSLSSSDTKLQQQARERAPQQAHEHREEREQLIYHTVTVTVNDSNSSSVSSSRRLWIEDKVNGTRVRECDRRLSAPTASVTGATSTSTITPPSPSSNVNTTLITQSRQESHKWNRNSIPVTSHTATGDSSRAGRQSRLLPPLQAPRQKESPEKKREMRESPVRLSIGAPSSPPSPATTGTTLVDPGSDSPPIPDFMSLPPLPSISASAMSPPPASPVVDMQSASSRLYGSAEQLSRLLSPAPSHVSMAAEPAASRNTCPSPAPTVVSLHSGLRPDLRSKARSSSLRLWSNHSLHDLVSLASGPGTDLPSLHSLQSQVSRTESRRSIGSSSDWTQSKQALCTCGIPPPPPPLQFTRYFVTMQSQRQQPTSQTRWQAAVDEEACISLQAAAVRSQRPVSGSGIRVWTSASHAQPLKLRPQEEMRSLTESVQVQSDRRSMSQGMAEAGEVRRNTGSHVKTIQRPGFLKRTIAATHPSSPHTH